MKKNNSVFFSQSGDGQSRRLEDSCRMSGQEDSSSMFGQEDSSGMSGQEDSSGRFQVPGQQSPGGVSGSEFLGEGSGNCHSNPYWFIEMKTSYQVSTDIVRKYSFTKFSTCRILW